MYIKKLSVDSFGKIKNEVFSLQKGLNVIYGPNESGKTTFVSFIRYMLYGFHGRKTQSNLTFEERYLPWDNTAVSGSMEYEYDGKDFLTYRSNGVRKEYSTLNNTTGVSAFEGVEPGEEMFLLNDSSFLRTYFLSSTSCVFSNEKNDDILKRLSNLATTGDADISHDEVTHKMKSDKKILVGQYNEKNAQISDCKKRLENISRLKERQTALNQSLYSADTDILDMRENIDLTDKQNETYMHLNEKVQSLRLHQILKLIIFVLLCILSGVIATSSVFPHSLSYVTIAFAVFVLFLIAFSRFRISAIISKINSLKQDANLYSGDVKSKMNKTEIRKNEILKELGGIEIQLENEYARDDLISQIDLLSEEKDEISRKIAIIDKASYIFDSAYENLKNMFVPELNKRTIKHISISARVQVSLCISH